MKQDNFLVKYWPIITSIIILAATWGTLRAAVAQNRYDLEDTKQEIRTFKAEYNNTVLQSAKDMGEIKGDIKAIKAGLGIRDVK